MRSATYFLFVLLSFCSCIASAQVTVSGKVTDETGAPVPFVSVYQKNTTIGTSGNLEGEFRLKMPSGRSELVVKAVGFKQHVEVLDVTADKQLKIILKPEVYQLKDVVVNAADDPANEIIRNAIRKRKFYQTQVETYSCEVYIKGVQKLLAAPKKFMGRDIDKLGKQIGLDSNRSGILYLSESESRYSFSQPDKVHEEMISSKVSGSNRSFSFNRASDMDFNFYQNLQNMGNLSNRPMISPIADNAFSYYRYKFRGTSVENGQLINKIEIIPKRKGDPVFQGAIYIVEDSWRMHSADVFVTKDASINFVDTLKINQQFFPVKDDVWMPSGVKFEFKGGLFGFRFGGYYISVYKNYDISPKINKKLFAEVMRVTREVNQKDSSYWKEARPIPLTEEERSDYVKKAVLATKRESRTYLDSIDKENNKFKPFQFVLGSGYSVRHRYKHEMIRFRSLKDAFYYNTVEGAGLDYSVNYSRQLDSATGRYIMLRGKVRYGFTTHDVHPVIGATIPIKKSVLSFNGGSDIIDLNENGSISAFGNTINTLLYERNFMKLYQKSFASLSISRRLIGSAQFLLSGEWAERNWLENTRSYTIRDLKDREFTSNNPLAPSQNVPLFPTNQSLKLSLQASYDFGNKYVTYPRGRFYVRSKYPRLTVNYTKGVAGVLGSDVDYDLLTANITRSNIGLGLYGKFEFWVGAGAFLNNSKLFYPDYKHFVGNRSLAYKPTGKSFIFLDFYKYSTPENYVEAHLEHNFAGLFLNKIPLIRKLKFQEIVGANYLNEPGFRNYSEIYGGLQYLNFRVLIGASRQGKTKMDSGFRLAYGF